MDSKDTWVDNSYEMHPAVATWFAKRFSEGPTQAQVKGWPAIASRQDTLIAAPTGSGKTLAGFLIAIDNLYKRHSNGEKVANTSQVVYVSPLKALANDIAENLERPLAEIADTAKTMGIEPPELTVATRTSDTPNHVRAAMLKHPPNFVITTPESLYLLLTAAKSRENLRSIETVIVDEIHATAKDKRGSHLALSLERLEHVAHTRPSRIGLSATQRPIDTIAKLLVGVGNPCNIVDTGHKRDLDISLELIDDELAAVTSHAQMDQVLEQMAKLICQHHTTIVFVNTRRLAERLAHQLGERLGEDNVAAHHGSLSTERRNTTEQRLRNGNLKALVATASLELGIDIGPVELVCQVGSPRNIATFLQRVGRSNHSRQGTPKGRLFPLTCDELIECMALLKAVRHGCLDSICPPVAPLDILVQQIIAETAAEDSHTVDGLYTMFAKAAPYCNLTSEQFQQALTLASKGVITGRGPRGAYLHYDTINQEIRGKRGARLAAITSGGAIGENGDYRVLAEPTEEFIGTVNEDWAVESMAGDIFLLGSHSWQIKQVTAGTVRVADAGDAPPTVPFWLGEAPGRSAELSAEVSTMRKEIGCFVGDVQQLAKAQNMPAAAAEQASNYIAAGQTALGVIPSQQDIVFERFFDETGGQQLVVHCPYGARINRAFGLALRKRFCRQFDFELQAAATDNAIILSLGPQHSFQLSDVPNFLHPSSVKEILQQAVLDSPMFAARWRWNLNRALVVLRSKGGKRNPAAIQRMEANDIMAAVFPQAAACQENIAGPIQIPNHLLVQQTLHDTLHEALDTEGLQKLLTDIHAHKVRTHFCDTTEPSPFSHEIVNARPYAFLDDAEIVDRRTNAVATPRTLRGLYDQNATSSGQLLDAHCLSRITPAAVAQVVSETAPNPKNPDELHELLTSVVCMKAHAGWQEMYDNLAAKGRVRTLDNGLWTTAELADEALSSNQNIAKIRGHLDVTGPVSPKKLSEQTALTVAEVKQALAELESQGMAMRCPKLADERPTARQNNSELWCARRLLMRMSYLSRRSKRAAIKPASAQDFMRFLLEWQHLTPETTLKGQAGLCKVLEQLQGLDLPAVAWETQVIARRVTGYEPFWLDELSYRGEVAWLRLTPPPTTTQLNTLAPRKATPITLVFREDLAWLLAAARPISAELPTVGAVSEIAEILDERGASFMGELAATTNRLPDDITRALWNGVALGLFTADGFAAVRALLNRNTHSKARRHKTRSYRRLVPKTNLNRLQNHVAPGRWSLVETPPAIPADQLSEAVAQQMLNCWGVVFRSLALHPANPTTTPWRDILRALRRFEDRGIVRAGRFVAGQSGEQFALPAAADQLNATRQRARSGQKITITACDPVNLTGVLFEGPRIPATLNNTLTLIDGIPTTT